MYKAHVAKERLLQDYPNLNIHSYNDNIKDDKFGIKFFQQFQLVIMALDNTETRSYVNRICMALSIPLLDAGTTGYKGQAFLLRRGKTRCYDCFPKDTSQKVYPACTIRTLPEKPVHCVIWSKYLFGVLFGPADDESNLLVDLKESLSNNDKNHQATFQDYQQEALKVAQELFYISIKKQMEKKKMEEEGKENEQEEYSEKFKFLKPVNVEEDYQKLNLLDKYSQVYKNNTLEFLKNIHSIKEYIEIFRDSFAELIQRKVKEEMVAFEKDDPIIIKFLSAACNLRCHIFNIPLQNEFQIKQISGNIIPAIASTNAIVAAIEITETLKYLSNLNQQNQQKKYKELFVQNDKEANLFYEYNDYLEDDEIEANKLKEKKTLQEIFGLGDSKINITNEETGNLYRLYIIVHKSGQTQIESIRQVPFEKRQEVNMQAIMKERGVNMKGEEELEEEKKQFEKNAKQINGNTLEIQDSDDDIQEVNEETSQKIEMESKRQPRQRSSQLDIERIFQHSEKIKQKKLFRAQKKAFLQKKTHSELVQSQNGLICFQNRLNNLTSLHQLNSKTSQINEINIKAQTYIQLNKNKKNVKNPEQIIEENSILYQSNISNENQKAEEKQYEIQEEFKELNLSNNKKNDFMENIINQIGNPQIQAQKQISQQNNDNFQNQKLKIETKNNQHSTYMENYNQQSVMQTQMVSEINTYYQRNNNDSENEKNNFQQQNKQLYDLTVLNSNNTTSSSSCNVQSLQNNLSGNQFYQQQNSSSSFGYKQTMEELEIEEKELKKLQKKLEKKYHFQRLLKNLEISEQQNTYKVFSYIKQSVQTDNSLIHIVISIFQKLFTEKYSFFMQYKPNEVRNEAVEFIFESIINDIQFIFNFIQRLLHTFYDDFVANSLPKLDINYKDNEYKFITIRIIYKNKYINKTLMKIIDLKNYKEKRQLKKNIQALQDISIQNELLNINKEFQLNNQNQLDDSNNQFFEFYDTNDSILKYKPYQKVIDQIKTISKGISPVMKFEIIVNLRQKIFEVIDEYYNLDNYANLSPIKKQQSKENSPNYISQQPANDNKQLQVDGDTIDNILIYCIIQSKQYNLANQLEYIQEFMPEDLSYAYEEGSSFFSRFLLVVMYLQSLNQDEIQKFLKQEQEIQDIKYQTQITQINEIKSIKKQKKANVNQQQNNIQELVQEESSEKYKSSIQNNSENFDTQQSFIADNDSQVQVAAFEV
ncbi:Molybdenum cofactor biosynthesis, MoeB [Pseudocohnilembus persalinus]|uniref:Molybdenum cofactor biosynthesis, MoeB n=1 Tax=Pseudocohnilembus persalinus TaxID=266149 RepID=A0A0V0QYA4_PSEPJ|nr:Molybdenum cofactor biosynthesis, MoeB [Pseudocohnilembus persalinus]|eukprot:KRX07271.1 Molybdenum cofactor biosynthesis, MoeB [Pseudocohnilembus persalinus]